MKNEAYTVYKYWIRNEKDHYTHLENSTTEYSNKV